MRSGTHPGSNPSFAALVTPPTHHGHLRGSYPIPSDLSLVAPFAIASAQVPAIGARDAVAAHASYQADFIPHHSLVAPTVGDYEVDEDIDEDDFKTAMSHEDREDEETEDAYDLDAESVGSNDSELDERRPEANINDSLPEEPKTWFSSFMLAVVRVAQLCAIVNPGLQAYRQANISESNFPYRANESDLHFGSPIDPDRYNTSAYPEPLIHRSTMRGLQTTGLAVDVRMADIKSYAFENLTTIVPLNTFTLPNASVVLLQGNDDDPPASVTWTKYPNKVFSMLTLPGVSGYQSTSAPYSTYSTSIIGRGGSNVAIVGSTGYVARQDQIYVYNFTSGQIPSLVGAAALTQASGAPSFSPSGSLIEFINGALHVSGRLTVDNSTAYGIYSIQGQSSLRLEGARNISETIYRMKSSSLGGTSFTILQTPTRVLGINTTSASQINQLFQMGEDPNDPYYYATFRLFGFDLFKNRLGVTTSRGYRFFTINSNSLSLTELPPYSMLSGHQDIALLNETFGFASDSNNGFLVQDLTNSSSPKTLSNIFPPDSDTSSSSKRYLEIVGDRLYFVGAQTYIYDISDVRNVKLLAEFVFKNIFPALPVGLNNFQQVRYQIAGSLLLVTLTTQGGERFCVIDASSGKLEAHGEIRVNFALSDRGQTVAMKVVASYPGNSPAISRFNLIGLVRKPEVVTAPSKTLRSNVLVEDKEFLPLIARIRNQDSDAVTYQALVNGQSPASTLATMAIEAVSSSDFNQSVWVATNPNQALILLNSNQSILARVPSLNGTVTKFFDLLGYDGSTVASYTTTDDNIARSSTSLIPVTSEQLIMVYWRAVASTKVSNVTLLTRNGSTYNATTLMNDYADLGYALFESRLYWKSSVDSLIKMLNLTPYIGLKHNSVGQPYSSSKGESFGGTVANSKYLLLNTYSSISFFNLPTTATSSNVPITQYNPVQSRPIKIQLVGAAFNQLVVVQDQVGVIILDISNAFSIKQLSQLSLTGIGTVNSFYIPPEDQSLLFIACDLGIVVVDISDFTQPLQLYTLPMPGTPLSVVVNGADMFVSISGQNILKFTAPAGDWHNSHFVRILANRLSQGTYSLGVRATNPFGDYVDYNSPWVVENIGPFTNATAQGLVRNETKETNKYFTSEPLPVDLFGDVDLDDLTITAWLVDASGNLQLLPPYLQFYSSTRVIAGQFPPGEQGSYHFCFIADDGFGGKAYAYKYLINPNRAPKSRGYRNVTITAGSDIPVSATGVWSDANADELSYSVTTAGPGITAVVDSGTGDLSLATLPKGQGLSTYTVRASDGRDYTETTGYVSYVNTGPTLEPEAMPDAEVGVPYTYQYAPCNDVDGDDCTDIVANIPQGFSYNSSIRTVSGIPRNTQVGSLMFVRRVSDGKVTVPQFNFLTVKKSLSVELATIYLSYREQQTVSEYSVIGSQANITITGSAAGPANVTVIVTNTVTNTGSLFVLRSTRVSVVEELGKLTIVGLPEDVTACLQTLALRTKQYYNQLVSLTLQIFDGRNEPFTTTLYASGVAVDSGIQPPTETMDEIIAYPLRDSDVQQIPEFGNEDGNELRYSVAIINANGTTVASDTNITAWGNVTVNQPRATFVVKPARKTHGNYLVRITATALDVSGNPIVNKFASTTTNMKVGNLDSILVSQTLPDALVDEDYSFTFDPVGNPDEDDLVEYFIDLPRGLSYSGRTISGRGGVGMLGTTMITRAVFDGITTIKQPYFLNGKGTLNVVVGKTAFNYTESVSKVFGDEADITIEGRANSSEPVVAYLFYSTSSVAQLVGLPTAGVTADATNPGTLKLTGLPAQVQTYLRSVAMEPKAGYNQQITINLLVTYGSNIPFQQSLNFAGISVENAITPPLGNITFIDAYPSVDTPTQAIPEFGNIDGDVLVYDITVYNRTGSIVATDTDRTNGWRIDINQAAKTFVMNAPAGSQDNYLLVIKASAQGKPNKYATTSTTLRVKNNAPTLVSETLNNAEVGGRYTHQFLAPTDVDGDRIVSDVLIGMPSGFSYTNGLLEGTGLSSMLGTIPLTRVVSDGIASATQTYFLTTRPSLDLLIGRTTFNYTSDQSLVFGESAAIDIIGSQTQARPVTAYVINPGATLIAMRVNKTLSGISVDDSQSSILTITGLPDDVERCLKTLSFTPPLAFARPFSLDFVLTDGFNAAKSTSFQFTGIAVDHGITPPTLPMAKLEGAPGQVITASIPPFGNLDLNKLNYIIEVINNNGTLIASSESLNGWGIQVNHELATFAIVPPQGSQESYLVKAIALALDTAGIQIPGKTSFVMTSLKVKNIEPVLSGTMSDQVWSSGREFAAPIPAATSPVGNNITVSLATTTGGVAPSWVRIVEDASGTRYVQGTVPREEQGAYSLMLIYDDGFGGVITKPFLVNTRVGLLAQNNPDAFDQNQAETYFSSFEVDYPGANPVNATIRIPRRLGSPILPSGLTNVTITTSYDARSAEYVVNVFGTKENVNPILKRIGFSLTRNNPGVHEVTASYDNGVDPIVPYVHRITIRHLNQPPYVAFPMNNVTLIEGDVKEVQVQGLIVFSDPDKEGGFSDPLTFFNGGPLPEGVEWVQATTTYKIQALAAGSFTLYPGARDEAGLEVLNPIDITVRPKPYQAFYQSIWEAYGNYITYGLSGLASSPLVVKLLSVGNHMINSCWQGRKARQATTVIKAYRTTLNTKHPAVVDNIRVSDLERNIRSLLIAIMTIVNNDAIKTDVGKFMGLVEQFDDQVSMMLISEYPKTDIPRALERQIVVAQNFVGELIKSALMDGDKDTETKELARFNISLIMFLLYLRYFHEREIEIKDQLVMLNQLLATPGVKDNRCVKFGRALFHFIFFCCPRSSQQTMDDDLKVLLKTAIALISLFSNDDNLRQKIGRVTHALDGAIVPPPTVIWALELVDLRIKNIFISSDTSVLVKVLKSYLAVPTERRHILSAYRHQLDRLYGYYKHELLRNGYTGDVDHAYDPKDPLRSTLRFTDTLLAIRLVHAALDIRSRLLFILNNGAAAEKLDTKLKGSDFNSVKACLDKMIADFRTFCADSASGSLMATVRATSSLHSELGENKDVIALYVVALTRIAREHSEGAIRQQAYQELNSRGYPVVYSYSDYMRVLCGRRNRGTKAEQAVALMLSTASAKVVNPLHKPEGEASEERASVTGWSSDNSIFAMSKSGTSVALSTTSSPALSAVSQVRSMSVGSASDGECAVVAMSPPVRASGAGLTGYRVAELSNVAAMRLPAPAQGAGFTDTRVAEVAEAMSTPPAVRTVSLSAAPSVRRLRLSPTAADSHGGRGATGFFTSLTQGLGRNSAIVSRAEPTALGWAGDTDRDERIFANPLQTSARKPGSSAAPAADAGLFPGSRVRGSKVGAVLEGAVTTSPLVQAAAAVKRAGAV